MSKSKPTISQANAYHLLAACQYTLTLMKCGQSVDLSTNAAHVLQKAIDKVKK